MIALALTVFEILKFYIFDLQKVGQGDGVQFFALTPLDGKCQNLQKTPTICSLILAVSDILKFKICDLQKVDQRHGVHISQ